MTIANMSRPVEACHTFVVAKELIKAWNQSGAPGGQKRLAEVHDWARRMFPDIAVKTRSATELIDELMEWAFVQSVLVCVHAGVASGCPESNPPNSVMSGKNQDENPSNPSINPPITDDNQVNAGDSVNNESKGG